MRLKTCDPTQTIDPWHYNYDECIARVAELDFLSQYLSAECDALAASYYNCVAALSCDVILRLNQPNPMSDELDACLEETDEEYAFRLACYSMLP